VIIQAPRSPVAALTPYRPAFDITGADIFPIAYPPGQHSDLANRLAQAMKAGLVDEYHLFVAPVVVGGGKRSLPDDGVRVSLELVHERWFRNGTVYLRFRARS
jgi:RibD C-terminal domain